MERAISPFRAGLKGALMSSAILTVVLSLAILTGWFNFIEQGGTKFFILIGAGTLVALTTIFLAQRNFRQDNEALMTFGEGLSISIIMGILTAVAIAFAMFLLMSYKLEDMLTEVDMNSMRDEGIRLPVISAFSVGMSTFFGFLGTGFVVSLLMRRD